MESLGLQQTYKKVMSANGPAQMLTYAFWGVLMAGMFRGVCDMCFPDSLLLFWGSVSAAVVPITIWGTRAWLRNVLLLDVVISAYIMIVFLTHEPHTTEMVYYTMSLDGMSAAERGHGHSISDWFHAAALVWITFHALYLADLTHRQILEKRLFSDDL